MKKKTILLFALLPLINILFVRMSCGRKPNCFKPMRITVTPIDNADSIEHAPYSKGVIAKAFILEYAFSIESYYCSRNSFGFNNAYAQTSTSKTFKVDSIHLASDHDFDAQHPAGTDLKDLFFKSTPYTWSGRFSLLHAPSDTGTHVFTIKAYTTDSIGIFTASSIPVKLLL